MILAYHNEPKLKEKVIERIIKHRRMDQIVQQVYWEDNKGCLLGCLTHYNENTHKAAERLFGIEQRVGYWLEYVFEGIPSDQCAWWVVESLKAIPCGADLSLCHHHFAAWLLQSNLLTITDINRGEISQVRDLHIQAASGVQVSDGEWAAAGSAAWSVRSAARSAAESAVWSALSAARSAARSDRSAAAAAVSAARSAARSDRSAAASAVWKAMADKSLEIFAAAPVMQEKHDCPECVSEAWDILNYDNTFIKTKQ